MKQTDIKYSEKYKKTRSGVNKFEYSKIKSKVDNYENDPKKKDRLSKQLCKSCYYLILPFTIGFDAFIFTNCLNCGIEITSHNSIVDVLCIECAKKHDACKHCGGEMD